MHRIVVDLGPAGKPREARLLNALAEREMVPTYIVGPGSFGSLGAPRRAFFHDVDLAVRGGVFDEF